MKRRVLVIDDHIPSREFLRETLNRLGFEVAGEGASGKEAVDMATKTAPDLVLMAVELADMDGISAASGVMEACVVPVIVVTNRYDAGTINRANLAGVMGYLIKPLREADLLPALELSISRHGEFMALRRENENLKETLRVRKTIERAKGIIMERHRLSEPEAFSLIQRKSMDARKPMVEIASAIILTEEMNRIKAT